MQLSKALTRPYRSLTCATPRAAAPRALSRAAPVSIAPSAPSSFAQYSSTQAEGKQGKQGGLRQGHLLSLLVCAGLGVTIYSILEFYSSFTTWPKEVRDDLRLAIKCRNSGDYVKSEDLFRKALETAQTLPPETLKPTPLLALTGISVSLATMLESAGRPAAALRVLEPALSSIVSLREDELLPAERMRAVAMSQKMGDLALRVVSDDVAEKYLEWGVEEMLKMALAGRKIKGEEGENLLVHELQLPKWITRTDLGAALEALGAVYARQGRAQDAVPLYIQALTLLMPPPESRTREPTKDEKCRAGLLMNNLSQILTSHPSTANLRTALTWADKSVDVTSAAAGSPTPSAPEDSASILCGQTLAAGLFNLGVLHEMLENPKEAKSNYHRSIEESQKVGLREGVREAKEALRRMEQAKST